MLKSVLIHPEILHALGQMGHGSQILIADGNYPFSTESPVTANKVFLNLSPGILLVTDVLKALVPLIPIDAVTLMVTPDNLEQPIYKEFQQLLPHVQDYKRLQRFEFYAVLESARAKGDGGQSGRG